MLFVMFLRTFLVASSWIKLLQLCSASDKQSNDEEIIISLVSFLNVLVIQKREVRNVETPGRNSWHNFVNRLSQSPMKGEVEFKGRNSGLRNYRVSYWS